MISDNANLVDEDRLAEFFDELDDRPRVLRFIEELRRLPFVQQRLRLFLDVFQGSTDD